MQRLTAIHKNHVDAYRGWAKPKDWDPDRVAELGLKGCDMRQDDWKVTSDKFAFRRLKFTEEMWAAGRKLLLDGSVVLRMHWNY